MKPGKAILDELPFTGPVNVMAELSGGPASDSFLLECGEQRVVLRIDKPLVSAIGLDRKAEVDVLNAVAAAGLGPHVVWADPAQGILVTGYLDGKIWDRHDLRVESNLERLGALFRKLHALPPAGPEFHATEWAEKYALHLQSKTGRVLAERVKHIDRCLEEQPVPAVLCHNDPVAGNIVDSGELYLIDWEYAGVGDPYFDLAAVTAFHELPEAAVDPLLESCFGSADSGHHARLAMAAELYDCLHLLWLMLVIAAGQGVPAGVAHSRELAARLGVAGFRGDRAAGH